MTELEELAISHQKEKLEELVRTQRAIITGLNGATYKLLEALQNIYYKEEED